ncbi:uncharacterized protein LOC143018497 [Oratosquilla oratoria]|uniref:uncharacterized protein LOC143018497 n=1 Tax=Oratosquilla oratoria TaxID=337810 RepID=UPI003F76A654
MAATRWISKKVKKCCDRKENKTGSSKKTPEEDKGFKNLITRIPKEEILQENKKKAETYLCSSDWCEVKFLGRGAFGKVVLMKNMTSKELVAHKIVHRFFLLTSLWEAFVHYQIQHSNVVQLICFKRALNKTVLCLEYRAQGTVFNVCSHINEEEAHKLFSQLMEAVEHLHSRGVVHRDLKPKNLLLMEEKVLKVADFSIARIYIVEKKEVLFKGCVGTRAYIAPEILACLKYSGPLADLWSCGQCFHF